MKIILLITQLKQITFKKDIKMYMNEFGFNNFEILIIKKIKKYMEIQQ